MAQPDPVAPDSWTRAIQRRLGLATGILVTVALVGAVVTQASHVQGSAALHLQIEYFAVFAAISAFFLASAKYVISRDRLFLPLSLGFLGSALYDLLHPLVPPGRLPAEILGVRLALNDAGGYLWLLGRLSVGLGFLLALRQLARPRSDPNASRTLGTALAGCLAVFLVSLVLLAAIPLPAYFGPGGASRLLEFAPLVLYVAAASLLARAATHGATGLHAVGGASLILATVAQLLAATSQYAEDAYFFTAHALKVASFLVILFGLYLEHVVLYSREHELRTSVEQAEREALRRRAELFAILENTSDAIAIVDPQGGLRQMNRAARAFLRPGDRADASFLDALPIAPDANEDMARLRAALGAALGQGSEARDLPIVLQAGGERRLDFTVGIAPLREDKGRIRGAVLDFHDVTSVRQAEKRYRDLTEGAPDGIIEITHDGTIAFLNQAALRIFGYDRDEVLGKPVTQLMPDRLAAPHEEARRRFMDSGVSTLAGRPVELFGLHRDGREIPIELTVSTTPTPGSRRVTAILRDVRSLQRSRREKAGLIALGEAIATTNELKPLCQAAAEGLVRALNYEAACLYVKDASRPVLVPAGIAQRAQPDAQPARRVQRLEPPDPGFIVRTFLERKAVAVTGKEAHAEILAIPTAPPVDEPLVLAIPIFITDQTAGVLSVLTSAKRHTADEELPVLESITFQLALALSQKRLLQELQESAHNLEVTNRELDAFIYTASHDLAEPLRSMANFSQFLMEDYGAKLDDQGRDYIKRIHDGALRMRGLLDALLQISRIRHKPLPFEKVDTRRLLSEVRESLDAMIRERNADIVIREPVPSIYAQPARVMEVFNNLVSNGLKFNQSERPRVEIQGIEKNGFVEFRVTDNGIGIPAKYLDRVFGLFTRLHARGHYPGTGAGLAIVRRIIEQHGGRVEIQSREGQGTTVSFTVPREAPP